MNTTLITTSTHYAIIPANCTQTLRFENILTPQAYKFGYLWNEDKFEYCTSPKHVHSHHWGTAVQKCY